MTANFAANNSQFSIQNIPSRQLVFIDDRVDNYPSLAAGLANGVEAIVLHRDRDGIEQITAEIQKYAAVYGSLDAIHIFSHGSQGQLQLGSTSIDSDNVQQHASQLQQWKSALTDSSDILLYGCDVASGEKGAAFVKQLSQLTGADISASVDLTGNAASGGDWDLEFATGKIEAPEVLSPAIAGYKSTLATLTVTNNADSGPGSLRNAIATAAAGDTIVFAPSLANQTITLTSGQLDINKNLIIDGAAAPNLTISGNNASRVFIARTNTIVNLKNLTIANGKLSNDPTNESTSAGAGILTENNCNLTVENCKVRNNVAGFGAGIYGGFRSTNTVINSTFDGNDGSLAINTERGGGAIGVKSGSTLSVTGSTFTNNKGTNGAAINSLLSTLTVQNSTFLNNDTTAGATTTPTFGYGGAIYTDGANASGPGATPGPVGGVITLRNNRFDGNKAAGQGGGLFLFGYAPDQIIIEGCTIVNNQVILKANGDSIGGGLRLGNAQFTISNTTFSNNSALKQGGGFWLGETSPGTITNSTFSGNKADDNSGNGLGGAITLNNSTNPVNIVNTTFANNHAGFMGGTFWGGGSTKTLKNTIVAYSTAGNPFNKNQHTGAQFTDAGGNIQWPPKNPSDATDINVTASVAIADPLLGTLQDNGGGILTHALLPGSPAIDSGTNTGAPTTDQRGITRPIDGDNNGSALVDSGAYEFTTATPEIQVLDNTTNIADNSTTALNFGTTTVGSSVSKTFTIRNTGSAALNLSNLQLPTGFTAVGTLPTTVAAGAQATFAVNLNATTPGNPNGQLSFTTNDSDENPFNFTITGTVNGIPEIQVLDNTTNIADNTTTALNFGTTTVGSAVSKTFTIRNTGSAALNLSNLQLPTGFTAVGTLPTTVAAGAQATFAVNLNSATPGNPNGQLSFTTNDSDENPFNFAIIGTVNGIPEIQVLDNTTNIADNTTTALNFGTTTAGSAISKTFTIRNTGSGALSLSNLQLPTGFTAVGTLPTAVAAGGQATLAVNLNSATAGNFNGQLSFTTNDSDENPFNFSISGIVNTPTTPPTPPDPSCLCDRFPTPNISIGNPTPNAVSITLNGTNANDTIAGSDASEAIFGNAGNDILTGMGGNDNIDGGSGNDQLYGNVGNDYIIGGLGNNTLFGGQDNDVLLGGAERDIIAGDFGNDTIFGGDGGDELYGNVGTDLIDGGTGNDTIFGGQDNDAINGGTGNDIVAGDIGDDTITGSDGNDELYGNTGADFIGGGTGEDTIFGGQDNDILKGGAGNDIVAGDIGNDTICGGDGNDQLYGNTENDLMDGCEGDDSLFGGQDNDTLIGNSGKDNLNGDLGNDEIYGNAGADTLNGGDGNDTLFGGLENDILTGGIGDDWLSGDFGNDTLTGSNGRDRFVLSANRGSDVITDFEDGIDLLGLAGGLTFAQLSITSGAIATDIRITSTGELLASLNGVQSTLIAASDFTVI